MAEPVESPKPEQLSARRQAILQAITPVVPSVSGDPDRKFFQIVGREDEDVERLKKASNVTTCLDLIGYCARAVGAVRGRHKIAGGAMQLQEDDINLGGWVERIYDPARDSLVQMIRAGNKAAIATALAAIKTGNAAMAPPTLSIPGFAAGGGFAPQLSLKPDFANLAKPEFFNIESYVAARQAEIRMPKPGDFFQIRTAPFFVKHVGVILSVNGGDVRTAEAGQAEKRMAPPGPDGKTEKIENPLKPGQMIFKMVNKEAAKIFDRKYDAKTGRFSTEKSQDNGFLFGWIDVDLMKLN